MNVAFVDYFLETLLPTLAALGLIGILSLNLFFFRKKRPPIVAATPGRPGGQSEAAMTGTAATPRIVVAGDCCQEPESLLELEGVAAVAQRTHISSQTFQKRFLPASVVLQNNNLIPGETVQQLESCCASTTCRSTSGLIANGDLVAACNETKGHILKGADASARAQQQLDAAAASAVISPQTQCTAIEAKQQPSDPGIPPLSASAADQSGAKLSSTIASKFAGLVNGMAAVDQKKPATPATVATAKLSSATDSFVQNQSILKLTEQLALATAKCDCEGFEKLCDKDMTSFTYETHGNLVKGLQYSKFFIQAGVSQRVTSSVKSFLYNPRITLLGPDAACITYTNIIQYMDRSGVALTRESLETRIWKLVNDQWTCVHFHQSAGSAYPTATRLLE